MLDAYIIDRIRREREQRERRDDAFVPLHIDQPVPPPSERDRRREDEPSDQGSVEIDFHV